jgi:hypothetical protein
VPDKTPKKEGRMASKVHECSLQQQGNTLVPSSMCWALLLKNARQQGISPISYVSQMCI